MKTQDDGCFLSVTVSSSEVMFFRQSWPCSDLPSRPIWFQFDRKNGELVDMRPNCFFSDPDAVAALCQDAKQFAVETAGLPVRVK